VILGEAAALGLYFFFTFCLITNEKMLIFVKKRFYAYPSS
jgi:hypothetical protein